MRKHSSLTLVLLAASLGACGNDAPSSATVRSRLTSDLGYVLHTAKDASDGTTANLPGSSAFAIASGLFGSTSTAVQARLAPHARVKPLTDATSSGFDPDAAISWLNDNIFTDANNLGDGIYQIPPALLCTSTSVDSSGTTTQTVDADCVTRVTTADLRVRVEEADATLRFSLQVDANHDEPLSIALAHTSLAVTVDLDDASRAMVALATAFGEQAPNAQLAGAVTGKLEILGAAHAKASLSFDRAITVKVADQGADLDGPSAFRLTSGQADVLSVEADGQAPLLAASLGLAETTAHVPASSGSKAVDVDLAGVTADASYTGGNALTIDHISLGTKTTTVSYDGVQGLAIDLNANDGRELSAAITADPNTGEETTTVSPRLDLAVATNHAVIGDPAPVYDMTRLFLDGALATSPGSGITRVVSGSYSISTDPSQYGFSAAAGQCVTESDNIDTTTGSSYTAYSVSACQ